MKQTLKKIAIWFNCGFLVILLLILPSAFLFTFIFSQPQPVKDILKQSKIYPALGGMIADASVSSLQSAGADYGLSKEAIRRVSEKAFPASDIQQKSEGLIDDVFTWLRGDKPALEVRFDLEKNKQLLVQGLSEEEVKAAASKPVCTTQQLQQLASSQAQSSSLPATCRPSTLDINSLQATLEQSMSAVNTPEVTQAVASTQPAGKTLPQQNIFAVPKLDNTVYGVPIPLVFSILKNSFYIVLALIALVGLALFGLTRQLSRFLSVIGHPLLTTGILLVVYALVAQWFVGQNILSKLVAGEPSKSIDTVVHSFVAVSTSVVICFGATYIVLAIAMLVFNHWRKQKQPVDQTKQEVSDTPSSTASTV